MYLHPLRALACAGALLLASLSVANAQALVINELDYDQVGGDSAEYVEIKNVSAGPVDLSLYELQFLNGTSAALYRTIALSGTIAAGSYFVACADPATTPNCDLDASPDSDLIQNGGSDSVVLRAAGGGAVVDALSYEGTVTGIAEGTGTSAADSNAVAFIGLSRLPDGADSNDNNTDFSLRCITPGYENVAADTSCPTPTTIPTGPALIVDDVSLAEGNSDTNFAFTVTLTENADAEFTVNWHTEDSSATVADGDYLAMAGNLTFVGGIAGSQVVNIGVTGDATPEGDETFTLVLDNLTGATVDTSDSVGTGTILNDDIALAEIFSIQGPAGTSPFAGQVVRSEGNVVTGVGAEGFTIQTPDARSDADAQTSNGVYVFTFDAPTCDDGGTPRPVAIGDIVTVEGEVEEFFSFTEFSDPLVTCTGGAAPMPTAIVFEEDGASGDIPSLDPLVLYCGEVDGVQNNFECLEGMLVSVPDGIVTRGNQRFSGDEYGPVHIGPHGARALREPGVRFGNTLDAGDNDAAGVWDGNPEILEMDADFFGAVPAGTELVGGARFSATGVIAYSFSDYELWPTTLAVDAQTNLLPRPVRAREDDAELSIGSFNVLRLCNTADDEPNASFECDGDGGGPGGEPTESELAAKIEALGTYIGDVMSLPDVVGLQEVETLAVLQQLSTWINGNYATGYTAHLVEGNDGGGIDNGFLVNADRVSVIAVTQLQGDLDWFDPNDGGTASRLHDRPPLLLEAEFDGPLGGRPLRFAVMNNHAKSRGGVDTADAEGERNRAKRFHQGMAIAQAVQDYQLAPENAGAPLVLVGDYNDYQFGDGYVHLVGMVSGVYDNAANGCDTTLGNGTPEDCDLDAPPVVVPTLQNLVDVIGGVDTNQAYSYLFTENFGNVQGQARDVPTVQVLDHIMVSEPIEVLVAEAAYARANVDASVQGADTGSGPDGAGFTQSSLAIGSSDHDGLVAFFDTDCSSNAAGDGDSDGLCDLVDNCPAVGNADQDDNDADLAGDVCDADDDDDGDPDGADNCPFDANEDQFDTDGDDTGDVCDDDDDNDGVEDALDNCPFNDNPGQEDRDGDGEGDACDTSHIAEAADDAFTVDEDSVANSLAVLQNDSDVEGDSFQVTAASDPAHGTVTAATGSVSYSPDAGYCGADAFDYTITGGDTATVSIAVTCLDDAPTAVDDAVVTRYDAGEVDVDVLANDTDPDGGPLEVTGATQGSSGAVVYTAGGVSYAPASGFCGADSFTYTVNGGSSATVQVTVLCEGVFSDGFETE